MNWVSATSRLDTILQGYWNVFTSNGLSYQFDIIYQYWKIKEGGIQAMMIIGEFFLLVDTFSFLVWWGGGGG